MESWERMKKAVAGRWTGKPGKTGTTVLNSSESSDMVPVKPRISKRWRDGHKSNSVKEKQNTTNTASSMTKKIQTEGRGCLC